VGWWRSSNNAERSTNNLKIWVQYCHNFAIFAIVQKVWLATVPWFLQSRMRSPISDGI
jgi:hypothetical protein